MINPEEVKAICKFLTHEEYYLASWETYYDNQLDNIFCLDLKNQQYTTYLIFSFEESVDVELDRLMYKITKYPTVQRFYQVETSQFVSKFNTQVWMLFNKFSNHKIIKQPESCVRINKYENLLKTFKV